MVAVDNYIYILLGYNTYVHIGYTYYKIFKDLYKIDTYGNSKKIPLSYFVYNFDHYIHNFNTTATNNDIYVFFLNVGVTNNLHTDIDSTTVVSLLKITPTIRDHHLNGNIAKLRINNVITNDSEIIDNYSNLDYYYNQPL